MFGYITCIIIIKTKINFKNKTKMSIKRKLNVNFIYSWAAFQKCLR
jgi:hypothetical protein